MFQILYYLAVTIGTIALLKAFAAILGFFNILITRLNDSWAERYGKGSWALVTGCTEGIGKAFAFELAALGFKLLLVSRNEKKLQALSKQLWQLYPKLDIVIIAADFSQGSLSLYDKIYDKIRNLDLSILVNNVGIAHTKKFDQITSNQIEELINVNIKSMSYLTHKIIPMFLERKHKKCAIINISSQSIAFALKSLSVYTATKAYNDLFSRCLSEDYKNVIDIVDCVPAIVSTAGTNYTKDPFSCTSEQCARWTLKALGKAKATAGHWTHIFQYWFVSLIGQDVARWIAQLKFQDVADVKHN